MAVDKEKILHVFDEHFIYTGEVTISDNGLVSVSGDVSPRFMMKKLPVKFDRVDGSFMMSRNNLRTLLGSPRYVGGSFNCYDNELVSLRGAPEYINGNFSCNNNHLTTLVGAPSVVGRNFLCNRNRLETLEGAPQRVGGDFNCSENKLTNLKGSPKWVSGNFYCMFNKLTTLQDIPPVILRRFECDYSPTLRLCGIILSNFGSFNIKRDIHHIIHKYQNTGYTGMMPFATALIRAGYGDNAWL
jgi:hypothetical protein